MADSGSQASPRPIHVRTDAERSFRPRPNEPSPVANNVPAPIERTGLATVEPKHEDAPPVVSPEPIIVTPRVPAAPSAALPEPAVMPVKPVITPAAPVTSAKPVVTPTAAATPVPPVKVETKEKLAIAPPPRVPEATKEHVIQSGETYSSLATKYFGSEKYAALIAKANPGKDARRLLVGAKIVIPPAPAATTTQPAPAVAGTSIKKLRVPSEAPVAPVPPDRAYKVQAGESWHDLAQRFLGDGNRWTELYELNRERVPRNPSGLRPGMTIELPNKVAAPTSKPS